MKKKYLEAVQRAVGIVSKHTLLEPEEILSKDRHHPIALARHVSSALVYRKYKVSGCSLKELGKVLNQHHTTIIHSHRAVQNEIDTNPEFKQFFEQITREYNYVERLSN